MTWNETLVSWLPSLLSLLSPVLVALLGLVFVRLEQAIRIHLKQERLKAFALRLTDTARDVVVELEQTIVDDLKAKAADGRLTAEEKLEVLQTAQTRLMDRLGREAERGRALLEVEAPVFVDLLVAKIETQVAELRARGEW